MDRQITSEREGSNNSSPKLKIALHPWKKAEIPLSKDFFLLGWRKDASTLIRHSSKGISGKCDNGEGLHRPLLATTMCLS